MERYARLVLLFTCMMNVCGSFLRHVSIETSDTKWQHAGYNIRDTVEDGKMKEPSEKPQFKRVIAEERKTSKPSQLNATNMSTEIRRVLEVNNEDITGTPRQSNSSEGSDSSQQPDSTSWTVTEDHNNTESAKEILRSWKGENERNPDSNSLHLETAVDHKERTGEITKSESKLSTVIYYTSTTNGNNSSHSFDHLTRMTRVNVNSSKESNNSSDSFSYNSLYYSLNSSNTSQSNMEESSYTDQSYRHVTPETSSEVTPTDLIDPTSNEKKKDCPTCGGQGLSEEDVKELRMNMFADLLRQKLRMPEVPDDEEAVTQKPPVLPTDLLKRIFRNDTSSDDAEGFYAIDDEIIIPGEDMSSMCEGLNVSGCYQFDLKNKFSSDIATAYLWFNRSHEKLGKWRQPHIFVYEIEVHSGTTLKRKIHLARNDLLNKQDWVTVNLTMSVRRWVGEGAKNKLLAIKCKNCGTLHSDSDTDIQMDYKPVLEIKYFKTKAEQRKKKNANCDPRTECCKRPLDVNFNSINMHNIVLPNSLAVYFCYGYCDGVNQYTYNHTALKQRVRWTSNIDSSMREQLKPCCVPLVLKDAAVMVNENNDVVTKILPKVIVERCGCL